MLIVTTSFLLRMPDSLIHISTRQLPFLCTGYFMTLAAVSVIRSTNAYILYMMYRI